MMKCCTSCGKELRDEARFCSGCGKLCTEEMKEVGATKAEKEPAGKGKRKPVLLCVLIPVVALLITAGALAAWWFTSVEYKIMHALDAKEYNQAVAVVKEDKQIKSSALLGKLLKKRVQDIKADFVDKQIDYATAKEALLGIRRLDVDGVSDALKKVQSFVDALNQSRVSFAAAESFYNTGDYAEAIVNYRLVVADDENYETATKKLAEAEEQYRKATLDKAAQYAENELYAEAVALLKEAQKLLPDDTKIQEQMRGYEKLYGEKLKADAMKMAEDYAQQGDYYNAVKVLDGVMGSNAEDAQLVAAFYKYGDQYATQILRETDAKMAEKNFDEAMSLLREARKLLPDHEALTNKLKEVEAKKPISITSLLAVNTNKWGTWNEGSPTDPFGNDYSTACNYVIHTGYDLISMNMSHYTEYRLYGKYETLSGVFCTHIDSPEDRINRVQIYVDDKLVYTSKDFNRKSDATKFTVDVSGAEYVKIVVYTEAWAKAILSDVQLWP